MGECISENKSCSKAKAISDFGRMNSKDTQQNIPPQGYPMENSTAAKKKGFFRTKKKGDEKGFIEGCLAALCCCWLCEECC